MSDPGKEIAIEAAKAAAVELVKPGQEIVADVLGGLFADSLHNWRRNRPAWQERNQRETAERAAAILADKGVKRASEEANPIHVEEIIEASKDTTAPALKELYAQLVAAAMDPKRVGIYRREFVGIVNELEPLDAIVLPFLADAARLDPSRLINVSSRTGADVDAVQNSFRNLKQLELTSEMPGGAPQVYPAVTALGRQFLACVR